MAKARHAPAKLGETAPVRQGNHRTTSDQTEIAAAAYRFWQDRGCPIGSDQEDWFRAEVVLKETKDRLLESHEIEA